MKSKILNENKQELFDFRDFCGHYSEQCSITLKNIPNSRYFRNSQYDKVHFSEDGKDLFQSLFFYLGKISNFFCLVCLFEKIQLVRWKS